MSLELSAEQQEFQKSLRTFFSKETPSSYLKNRIQSQAGSDPSLWKKISELGLLSYFTSTDEETKPSFRELCLIAFEVGRVLVPENIGEVILAGPFLFFQFLEKEEQEKAKKILPQNFLKEVALEKHRGCLIPLFYEEILHYKKQESVCTLSGVFEYTPNIHDSNFVIICSSKELIFIDLLSQPKEKWKVETQPTLDRSLKYQKLSFDQISGVLLKTKSPQDYISLFRILKASEISGIVNYVVEMTLNYVKTRKQFGVPIGSFQAVQHKLAEMHLYSEAMCSLSRFASWAACVSKEQLNLSALSAFAFSVEYGAWVLESAIQLHGGIGFTWEYDLHWYLRRVKTIEALFCNKEKDYQEVLDSVQI